MNPKEKRQRIDLPSIENYHPYSGLVLVKPISKENATTKSGILIGFLPETQFGEGTESHVADLTSTEGTVIALPLHQQTEGYEIPNELEVGDKVWFSYFGSIHGVDIWVGKELFRLIDYSYMIAARRGEQTIILNGFILLEEIETKKSDVLQTIAQTDKTKGIVRYMGTKREYPSGSFYTDDIDLEIGDEVLIRRGTPDVKLERAAYLSTFSDKMYRRIRRRDILAVLNSFSVI
jgi:co-chaperonin GroES (HSP10)